MNLRTSLRPRRPRAALGAGVACGLLGVVVSAGVESTLADADHLASIALGTGAGVAFAAVAGALVAGGKTLAARFDTGVTAGLLAALVGVIPAILIVQGVVGLGSLVLPVGAAFAAVPLCLLAALVGAATGSALVDARAAAVFPRAALRRRAGLVFAAIPAGAAASILVFAIFLVTFPWENSDGPSQEEFRLLAAVAIAFVFALAYLGLLATGRRRLGAATYALHLAAAGAALAVALDLSSHADGRLFGFALLVELCGSIGFALASD